MLLAERPRTLDLNAWIQHVIREPLERAGLQPPETISRQEAWGVAIARCCREHGASVDVAMDVCQFLTGLEPQGIEDAFAQGRNCLLIVSGLVVPRLQSRESIYCGSIRQLIRDAEAEAGFQVEFLVIDVEPAGRQILGAAI